MRTLKYFPIIVVVSMIFLFSSCYNSNFSNKDFVHENFLHEVRLGDGVPLLLTVSVRWTLEDGPYFFDQFSSVDSFNLVVLRPRALELAKTISNQFPSVDSVFSSHRQIYINEIKQALMTNLGEQGITIKEIILSDIGFPATYTKAMEQVGLKRQEIERIRQMNEVELERATANKKKAEADGQVKIAQAEAQGKLQKIQAQTEKSRRKSELAKAETNKQVLRMEAQAEAEKLKLLAKADLEKKRGLKNLEVQKQEELEQIKINKQRQLDRVAFEQQLELARLCSENPTFASFLINKELASKVEIAVLPTGSDPNVFGGLLNQNMKVRPTGN